jgi:hypothetical protein
VVGWVRRALPAADLVVGAELLVARHQTLVVHRKYWIERRDDLLVPDVYRDLPLTQWRPFPGISYLTSRLTKNEIRPFLSIHPGRTTAWLDAQTSNRGAHRNLASHRRRHPRGCIALGTMALQSPHSTNRRDGRCRGPWPYRYDAEGKLRAKSVPQRERSF